jgi:2-polyprenyl-3-methyl-5-hydroxy-6-metoxy-1,4-benzoquinol methylase
MLDLKVQKKWNQIHTNGFHIGQTPQPAQVVVDFAHLLPKTGRVIDFACGTGGNALFLAKRGLECWAWDISDVVLNQLAAHAEKQQLNINAEVRDIENEPLPTESYDVIVVTHFLNRSVCDQIIKMLKPQGLLFYQTFTISALTLGIGPKNPGYLLENNELIKIFDGLHLHGYREDGVIVNSTAGLQGQAYLVARKHG